MTLPELVGGRLADNTSDDPTRRAPLVLGGHNAVTLTEALCHPVESRPTSSLWYAAWIMAILLLTVLAVTIGYVSIAGTGVLDNNQPIGWGLDMIIFVMWSGIGQGAVLFSAILFMFRQKWRIGIGRLAEMTGLSAICCTALFATVSLCWPWSANWLGTIRGGTGTGLNFHSCQTWNLLFFGFFLIVSLTFICAGLVPDLATLYYRARTRRGKAIHGTLFTRWPMAELSRSRAQRIYEFSILLAVPVGIVAISMTGLVFATSPLPGWHSLVFPPAFLATSLCGGLSMVTAMVLFVRRLFDLNEIITHRHIENLNKAVLATSLMVLYARGAELFATWWNVNPYEQFACLNQVEGTMMILYWIMIGCTTMVPQLFWFKRLRTHMILTLVVAVILHVGLWLDRYLFIVSPLNRDFLPWSWQDYIPGWVDLGMLAGGFGLFLALFLLFCRYLPVVSIDEITREMSETQQEKPK